MERIFLTILWIFIASITLAYNIKDLRFVPVTDSIIYRSSQPNLEDLKKLIKKFNIKTIVNLREFEECFKDSRCKDEYMVTKKINVKMIYFPITSVPKINNLKKIIHILCDPQYQPILIHCELGKARTGAVIAAYRVVCEGYPVEVALYEAQYFHYPKRKLKKLKDQLFQLKNIYKTHFKKISTELLKI